MGIEKKQRQIELTLSGAQADLAAALELLLSASRRIDELYIELEESPEKSDAKKS